MLSNVLELKKMLASRLPKLNAHQSFKPNGSSVFSILFVYTVVGQKWSTNAQVLWKFYKDFTWLRWAKL